MTIRSKLTAWYALVILVFTVVIGAMLFYELVVERKEHAAKVRNPETRYGEKEVDEIVAIFLGCGIPAAVLAMAGGWILMRKAMDPVRVLTSRLSQFSENNLRSEIPRTGNGDEFDQLTAVFNDMVKRLNTSFQRTRDFTLHASHELKTPLTIMRGEIEVALGEGSREPVLPSLLDEIERLTRIVDGLTFLTKADIGQLVLNKEIVDVRDLLDEARSNAEMLAAEKNLKVDLEASGGFTIHADRHRIRQLLLILVDNAVKYNLPGGHIRFSQKVVDEKIEITIENSGVTIPRELHQRVFERFYRVENSESRSIEGCGLGLSIAEGIVQAHRGFISLQSENGSIRVIIQLPLEKDQNPRMAQMVTART
ncbi:MAG: cztS [Verrucomicrobiales bacterium]|nr:cztS [Verrucomicrobiales bacterium]